MAPSSEIRQDPAASCEFGCTSATGSSPTAWCSNQTPRTEASAIGEAVSRSFVGVGAASNREELFALPLCCTSFISEASGPDRHYLPARDMQQIRDVVEARLAAYNNEHATMNLVLFDDAVFHVCRICRITQNPCGSALLVGVGGSGKQSLARLSSFINGQEVQTILVNQQYGLNELKCDLQEFYKKAAVKPATPQAFLLTDSQITDERFLVSINDMLSSGNIPDLFAREEYDNIFSSIRNAAKFANYADDREPLGNACPVAVFSWVPLSSLDWSGCSRNVVLQVL
ncbi:unnamed protein product [Durusdinium trenchii]|uniref:Dynein heavy chain AAA module D4 domain-containing protein n=1 Tax=Durusdinium trenchii TaxID=1381693 RepID=A0ABP0LQ16_9DINO